MFIYAFVLAGIFQREFPRYKLSYKLKSRTTYFCKENPYNIFCFQFFT